MAWWYGETADEIRAAYQDARRAPGWIVLGMIAVCWPISGFSLLPVGVAAGVWLIMMFFTRYLRWWLRRRIRRWSRPVIGILALVILVAQAGPWAWLLAVGLWLVFAGLTDKLRAKRRILAWVLDAVARTCRVNPATLHTIDDDWDGLTLKYAEVEFGADLRAEDPAVRERVAGAVQWALRYAGAYGVAWPPGVATFQIRTEAPMPRKVVEQPWGDGLPGIPVGITDPATADGTVDILDAHTSQVINSLPVTMIDPDDGRHILVAGGTGGGKSNWIRGFIARGLKNGKFPGGVFIFDGKGGSDYIVFEGREGVHCVAREPEEWAENIPKVSAMMRTRYDEDAEYERGHREKPYHPRALVVLDEIQEIRSTLGANNVDPFLQQSSRQMRAASMTDLLATQRPDAKDAIPGAVKDMLEYVIVMGYVSPVGAREILGQDWRVIVDEYGSETVPGRGMARIAGRLIRLQAFQLDTPRKNPAMEHFYPRKLAAAGAENQQQVAEQLPPNVIRWAPRRAPAQQAQQPGAQDGEGVDPDAATPPQGIPRIGDTTPAADETAAGGPRRRRTV